MRAFFAIEGKFDALKTFPLACNNIATIGTTQWPKSAPDPTFECVIWDESGDSTVCHGTQQLMDFTCVSQILVFWSSFEHTEHPVLILSVIII